MQGGRTASYASEGAYTAPARALAGAGQAMQQVGQDFADIALKHQQEQEDAWLAKAKAGTISEYETTKIDLRQRATGNASSHVEESATAYGGIVDRWAGQAPSERAQAKFREWADGWSVNPRVDAARFRAESEIAGKATSLSEAVQGYANAVFADPSKFDEIQTQLNADLEAARSWMTPEQEAKIRAESQRALSLARARREVEINPAAFLADTGAASSMSGDAGINAVVDQIIGVESGGRADAKNSRSSASGLGQFTDGTWIETVRRHRPDLSFMSDQEILKLKTDPTLGRQMVEAHTRDNAAALEAAGYAPTAGNLYLAHFAGIGGAQKVLAADPGASVESILGAAVVKANPFLKGMTAGDLVAWADKKMGGTGGEMRFAGNPKYDGLSYDEIIQLRGQATGMVDAAASTQRAATYDAIELAIASGGVVTRDQIMASPLPDGDKADLLGKLESRDKYAGPASELNKAIIGGGAVEINPFDPEQAKVGDKAYTDLIGRVPDENRASVQRDWVGATGYIPKDLARELRYNAGSNDPARLAAGLAQADAIASDNPQAYGAVDGLKDIQGRLDLYRHLTRDRGMSSEEAAAEILRRETDSVKVNREALKTDAGKFVKELTPADATAAFDTWLPGDEPTTGNPLQQNMLMAEFRAIAEDKFYETGGDAAAAKALAREEIRRKWGVSELSGERVLMRIPPEKYYPPVGGSHDYLREDALKTAQEWVAEAFPEREVTGVFVIATPDTRADIAAGRPPRYQLGYTYEQDGYEMREFVTGMWAADSGGAREGVREKFEEERARLDRRLEEEIELEEVEVTAPAPRQGADQMVDPSRMHERFQ